MFLYLNWGVCVPWMDICCELVLPVRSMFKKVTLNLNLLEVSIIMSQVADEGKIMFFPGVSRVT